MCIFNKHYEACFQPRLRLFMSVWELGTKLSEYKHKIELSLVHVVLISTSFIGEHWLPPWEAWCTYQPQLERGSILEACALFMVWWLFMVVKSE